MSYRDDDELQDDDYEPPVRAKSKKSGWTCLLVSLIGLGGGVVLLCCGGGTGLIWFGLNVATTEIENQLRENAVLKEHVGEIESFTMNFIRTGEIDREDHLVFDVKGSKARGEVEVDLSGDDSRFVNSAVLRLRDGTEIPLIPEAEESPSEEKPAEETPNAEAQDEKPPAE